MKVYVILADGFHVRGAHHVSYVHSVHLERADAEREWEKVLGEQEASRKNARIRNYQFVMEEGEIADVKGVA